MRKSAFLLTILILGLAAGCGVELPSPVPTDDPTTAPTSLPSPTSAPEEDTTALPTSEAESPESEPVSGSASCVASPFDFPVESRIPPVMEDDHTHGPADAPITLIEYADFQ